MTVPSLMGGQKPGPQKDISFKRDLTDLCCLPTSFPCRLPLWAGRITPCPSKTKGHFLVL